MKKTILAAMTAVMLSSTAHAGLFDIFDSSEFTNKCGSAEHVAGINVETLSERDKCWLSVYEADKEAGLLKEKAWIKHDGEYLSYPAKKIFQMKGDLKENYTTTMMKLIDEAEVVKIKENLLDRKETLENDARDLFTTSLDFQTAQADMVEIQQELKFINALLSLETKEEFDTAGAMYKVATIQGQEEFFAEMTSLLGTGFIVDSMDDAVEAMRSLNSSHDYAWTRVERSNAAYNNAVTSVNAYLPSEDALSHVASQEYVTWDHNRRLFQAIHTVHGIGYAAGVASASDAAEEVFEKVTDASNWQDVFGTDVTLESISELSDITRMIEALEYDFKFADLAAAKGSTESNWSPRLTSMNSNATIHSSIGNMNFLFNNNFNISVQVNGHNYDLGSRAFWWNGQTNGYTLDFDHNHWSTNQVAELMEDAYNDGYDDGYDAGYADGYEDGFSDGRAQ